MRFFVGFAAVSTSLFLAVSASAGQEPPPEPQAPAPAPVEEPAPPPVEATPPPAPVMPAEPETTEKPAQPVLRDHGLRVALDLGFARASTARSDNLTNGSPSLIPIGLDLSFRTSTKVLLGFHGSMALASRDDCLNADRCTARDYMFGPHVEAAFGAGKSFVPWFRYGMNVEILYRGGAAADGGAHEYRDGFDLVDARLGVDYILGHGDEGKTQRIGAFIGLIGGVGLGRTGATGSSAQLNGDERSGGHVWFPLGIRGTLDP
jgi:hypothetical protein